MIVLEEATAAQELLFSPMLADQLIILSLAMNVIFMFAFAYLIVKRKEVQETRFRKIESRLKKVEGDSKYLEERIQEIQPHRVVDKVADIKPFGMDFDDEQPAQPRRAETENSGGEWKDFIEGYNEIAEELNDKSIEKFIGDNTVRMLLYVGMMTFLPALDVEESNYWAWKIPGSDLFAVVPNPLKPCDENLFEDGGIKMIFNSNFEEGYVYRKYRVKKPATFIATDNGNWKLQDMGELTLNRK